MRVFRCADLGAAASDLLAGSGFVMDDGDVRGYREEISELIDLAREPGELIPAADNHGLAAQDFERLPIAAGAARRR